MIAKFDTSKMLKSVFRRQPGAEDIENRLRGTRWGHVALEFFTNTFYFPLANIFLELLSEGLDEFIEEPDLYIIIPAALLQAFFLGTWHYKNKPRPLVGNLIAPSLYTLFEVLFEGLGFFNEPQHIAYWAFSFTIGILQELRLHTHGKTANLFILTENVVRTCILLAMYWTFEAVTVPGNASFTAFFSEEDHVFISIVIPLLGIIVGLANISAMQYLSILRETAAQLRKYSEWLLGKELLSKAVSDHSALVLQSQTRTVLFMDIRGFTAWSESQPPQDVVGMLNLYYETAEKIWTKFPFVKAKLTGDEVMIVFPSSETACRAALEISREAEAVLMPHSLHAGIGLQSGHLVEGLLGSREMKIYDVIGDTVNTAKRICDVAKAGEVLIAQEVFTELGPHADALEPRKITVKGKAEPLTVYTLKSISQESGV